MKTISANRAGAELNRLVAEVAESNEPVQITGDHANAVLVSEDDWRSIQETLYLVSIPGMREKIQDGLNTPLDDCDDEPGW